METSNFVFPIRKISWEAEWLRREFYEGAKDRTSRHSQLACEMVVIRLYDAWARFCRELIIISACGKTRTLSGVKLRPSLPNITGRASVMPALLATYKKRTYEPDWEKSADCVEAGKRLAIKNLPTVTAALGATNSPAEEIRHVRNFFAHRRKGSAAFALKTGYFPKLNRPVVFNLDDYTVGNTTVLDSWIQRMLAVANAAVQ